MNMSYLKNYLIAFVCLFVAYTANAQDPTTYTFDGTVNNAWTTAGNWTPSYPGTSITEGEIIIIDALCRASGMTIEIGGGLIVNTGKELIVSATTLRIIGTMTINGNVSIQTNGMLLNSGYSTLENTGKIINNESVINEETFILEGSVVNSGQWMNSPFGEMQLLSMATFENNNTFNNSGIVEDFSSGFSNNLNFENNGELTISGVFENYGNFTNVSTIFVDGDLISKSMSTIFNHKLLDISAGATFTNSGTTYNFSSAQLNNSGTTYNFASGELINTGTITNGDSGRIFNQGTITTKGGLYFSMKPGSYLENQPGSAVTVN